jgi:hypothetical protein
MIQNIYRLPYTKERFSYVGLLRNEKKFNLGDDVFFAHKNNEIVLGKIVGVELPPTENAEYLYKIKIPEELVRNNMDTDDFYGGRNFESVTLNCQYIFSSIEEAKESALKNLERMAELQRQEIERYFGQFNKSQP